MDDVPQQVEELPVTTSRKDSKNAPLKLRRFHSNELMKFPYVMNLMNLIIVVSKTKKSTVRKLTQLTL